MVPSPERIKREVELLVTLGTAQFSTLGYAHPDVRATFSRAWRLCEQLDEDLPLEVLNGVSAATLASVDREGATALRPRFEKLARRPDPVSRFTGHSVLGVYDFYLGRYVDAAHRLGQARETLRSDDVKTFVEGYGYDGRLYCYVYELSSLWHLGQLERAAALCDEMQRLAESFGDPYVLCLALCATATHLIERGDAREALPVVDRIAPLAMEQRLYMWSAYAEATRGTALVLLGAAEEGLQALDFGQLQLEAMGLAASHVYFRQYVARAHMDLGRVADARDEIEAGLGVCRATLYTSLEPNFVILDGDLARLDGNDVAAESLYRRARALARAHGSRLMELRATVALARLVAKPKPPAEVLAYLRESYESFAEGRSYADLRAARSLIAELS
ncbi:MAG: hypothetical protein IPK07_13235 [Deltaproteobacteria bacterium]|nr:hypothetical protein [Deltaproteobacteria bacterium]